MSYERINIFEALSRSMNVTTVTCSERTRDQLAEFRDTEDYPNYDAALKALLDRA